MESKKSKLTFFTSEKNLNAMGKNVYNNFMTTGSLKLGGNTKIDGYTNLRETSLTYNFITTELNKLDTSGEFNTVNQIDHLRLTTDKTNQFSDIQHIRIETRSFSINHENINLGLSENDKNLGLRFDNLTKPSLPTLNKITITATPNLQTSMQPTNFTNQDSNALERTSRIMDSDKLELTTHLPENFLLKDHPQNTALESSVSMYTSQFMQLGIQILHDVDLRSKAIASVELAVEMPLGLQSGLPEWVKSIGKGSKESIRELNYLIHTAEHELQNLHKLSSPLGKTLLPDAIRIHSPKYQLTYNSIKIGDFPEAMFNFRNEFARSIHLSPSIERILTNSGRTLIGISLGISVYEISISEDKVKETKRQAAIQTGTYVGGIIGGSFFAPICEFTGPLEIPCVGLGMYLGGRAGAKIAESLLNDTDNSTHLDFVDTMKSIVSPSSQNQLSPPARFFHQKTPRPDLDEEVSIPNSGNQFNIGK